MSILENKIMAIISAENFGEQIQGLGTNHATPLLPVLSRYRLIDFVLSNIVNANIFPVYILTNKPNRHLFNYIGTGTNWDLNRKNGGISFLFASSDDASDSHNDLSALYKNLDHLARQKPDVILFTNANSINRVDYNEMYEKFMTSDVDVLWAYKKASKEKILKDNPILSLRANEEVTSFGINTGNLTSFNIDLGIYMLKKELFIKLINEAMITNVNQKLQDVIRKNVQNLKIMGYEVNGWVGQIRNLQEYFQQQMNALLDYNVTLQVFTKYPLYTREHDEPNAFYGKNANVSHCIMGSGVVIEGTVKNSIISRRVIIEQGSKIENCIILSNVTIQKNVTLRNVIVDQDSVITANKILEGSPEVPYVIVKKSLI